MRASAQGRYYNISRKKYSSRWHLLHRRGAIASSSSSRRDSMFFTVVAGYHLLHPRNEIACSSSSRRDGMMFLSAIDMLCGVPLYCRIACSILLPGEAENTTSVIGRREQRGIYVSREKKWSAYKFFSLIGT